MLASIFLTCLLPASSLYGQKIAVKSNLLYDLTTTFNIGGEIRCDDTHTLNLSVNYNLELRGKQKDEAFHAPTGVPQMV